MACNCRKRKFKVSLKLNYKDEVKYWVEDIELAKL